VGGPGLRRRRSARVRARGRDVSPRHTAPAAWSPGTALKYRQTLTAPPGHLAAIRAAAAADIAQLDTQSGAEALAAAWAAAFGVLAPATRARHLAALRSAIACWRGRGWLAGDPTAGWARPKVPVDATRALTRAQVAALWRLDVPLREKTLWRMLYETAARAEEILGLDVEDLELPGKRVRVISKGGMTEWVHWQTGRGAVGLAGVPPGHRQAGAAVDEGPHRAVRHPGLHTRRPDRPLRRAGRRPQDSGRARRRGGGAQA
jgi:integrase